MTRARRLAAVIATLAALLGCACGPKRIQTTTRGGQAQIVLLPDPDTGTVGRATVSNQSGAVDLVAARASTLVSPNEPPAPVEVLSEPDVSRLFGAALATLPPPPLHFTVYFRFDSDELTAESRALVPQILQAITARPFPDVLVIGHTDTTGTTAGNYGLGLRRAMVVRALLVQAGLDASFVEVSSHGDADLLVPTAKNVAEPRNRRVEVGVQ